MADEGDVRAAGSMRDSFDLLQACRLVMQTTGRIDELTLPFRPFRVLADEQAYVQVFHCKFVQR